MPDAQSQISSASKTTNRHKAKICARCGKLLKADWIRHWDRQHPNEKDNKQVWDGESPLIEEPWCTNWKEALSDAQPVEVRAEFQKGFTSTSSQVAVTKKKTKSTINHSSTYSNLGNEDVQMENIPQEEEKKEEVAVHQSEQVESNKILGKRSTSKSTGDLKHAVQEELQPEDSISNVGAPALPSGPQSKRINSNSNFVANVPAKAEIQTLTVKSLGKLEQTSVEQKMQTPHQQQHEFLVPMPVSQTIYVQQGQRDQQAIQKLRLLEQKRTGSKLAQVTDLLELVPFFTQPTVSKFIEQYKGQLTHIQDLLLMAQSKVEELNIEKISAIAFSSVLFGGSCWASLPKTFSSLDPTKLDQVLEIFSPSLAVQFNDCLAKWTCQQWRYLEDQTLLLLRYLKKESLEATLTVNICTISTMVRVEKLDEYLSISKVFSEYMAFHMVLASIKACDSQWKPECKLSFDEFVSLVDFLTESENKQLIKAKEEELNELPLGQWLQRLKAEKESSNIVDVSSVQFRLNQLQQLYGQLPKSYSTDLYLSGDGSYKRTRHHVANPPNSLQFANAQYAALSLRQYPKQLWCIPSGQGKSRTMAPIALILLLAGSTTKVHLVFDSLHLMKRDQKEFSDWYTFNQLDSKVEFHAGLDFECQPGDIILIDEADELILDDPVKFVAKIKQHRCICLTATPDNDDSQGVEREVLKFVGFSIFNGQATDHATLVSEQKPMSETLPYAADSELVSFIQEKLKDTAVLCYCSPEFLQLPTAANLPVTLMKDGENINDEFLRTLDNRTPEGTHVLLVALGSFGMRGFDYRANKKGITLVLAASFSNQRQAMQGLCRVGRFDDPCKRYIAKDISLVDKKEEIKYLARLNQFLNQNQKTKVVARLPEEKKRPATTTNTTTNTAKSTPAVGKGSKREKQTTGSQSTLTMIPKANLNKRQVNLLAPGLAQVEKKPDEVVLFGAKEEEEEERIVITASQLL